MCYLYFLSVMIVWNEIILLLYLYAWNGYRMYKRKTIIIIILWIVIIYQKINIIILKHNPRECVLYSIWYVYVTRRIFHLPEFYILALFSFMNILWILPNSTNRWYRCNTPQYITPTQLHVLCVLVGISYCLLVTP